MPRSSARSANREAPISTVAISASMMKMRRGKSSHVCVAARKTNASTSETTTAPTTLAASRAPA
jgi:hypothetical protein